MCYMLERSVVRRSEAQPRPDFAGLLLGCIEAKFCKYQAELSISRQLIGGDSLEDVRFVVHH